MLMLIIDILLESTTLIIQQHQQSLMQSRMDFQDYDTTASMADQALKMRFV